MILSVMLVSCTETLKKSAIDRDYGNYRESDCRHSIGPECENKGRQ